MSGKEQTIIDLINKCNAILDHMRRTETETGRPYMQFRAKEGAFIQKDTCPDGTVLQFTAQEFDLMREVFMRYGGAHD